MIISKEELMEKIKKMFKHYLEQTPGINVVYKYLARIKEGIVLKNEINGLIQEGRIVTLKPYSGWDKDKKIVHEIVHDVVKDYLATYRTMKPRAKTIKNINIPVGAILLHYPLALLNIPTAHEQYLKLVGIKTRNMIRKAEKQGYEFKEFVWNEHLEEIYNINTSKEVRQSSPMRGWYRELVKPRYFTTEELQYRKFYGAFKDGKLYAYLHLVLCGDFGYFRHFLGHAEHLTNGIMNGLISWTVKEYCGNSQIQWLSYGILTQQNISMHLFRRHAGFQEYATFLDLNDDLELIEFSRKARFIQWL